MPAGWWFFSFSARGFPGYRFLESEPTHDVVFTNDIKITIIHRNHVFSSMRRAFFIKIGRQLDCIISSWYFIKYFCEHQCTSKNRRFCLNRHSIMHVWQKNHRKVPGKCGGMGPDWYRFCHLQVHPPGSYSHAVRDSIIFMSIWDTLKSTFTYTTVWTKTQIFRTKYQKEHESGRLKAIELTCTTVWVVTGT